MDFIDSVEFRWIVIPALIFVSRIFDVTIGTIRIIFLSKGLKKLAPIFGFFEILIWLIAIKQLMEFSPNVVAYLAYAFGFAAGNFVGIIVEGKISIGQVIVRIITREGGGELTAYLRSKGFRITELEARGETGEVRVIFAVVKREKLRSLEKLVNEFNPNAFYTVEDIRFVKDGPLSEPNLVRNALFRRGRKGK